ncbi:hypothetical protein [Streptomyces adelaidensis]|uniref:hypothetical protein n=1 Tax=Streptomyces adelaidensis TaxID=2796465 RepID=UPI0019073393|nr:hypothetical protein [Streptomyces adelaidensis]
MTGLSDPGRKVAGEAVCQSVKDALTEVFEHINGGLGRGRRGGKEVERLPAQARSTAAGAGEWNVARMLHDSLDHAQGLILRPDFDERHRLTRYGGRDRIGRVPGPRRMRRRRFRVPHVETRAGPSPPHRRARRRGP